MIKIVPPPQSTKPKPKIMELVTKTYSKWSYAYFYFICLFSLFVFRLENYLTEIFPILVYLGFIVLFLNHLFWRKNLKFCTFKKTSTVALIAYFITCILAIIYKIDIYIYLSYFFVITSLFLFLFTLKDKEDVA